MIFSSSLVRRVEETRSKAGRYGKRKINPNPTKKLLALTTKISFEETQHESQSISTMNICPGCHGLCGSLHEHRVSGRGYPCLLAPVALWAPFALLWRVWRGENKAWKTQPKENEVGCWMLK